jgi:hypothetical protein
VTTAETVLGLVWMGFGAYAAGVTARTGAGPASLQAAASAVAFGLGIVLLAVSDESDVRVPEVSG